MYRSLLSYLEFGIRRNLSQGQSNASQIHFPVHVWHLKRRPEFDLYFGFYRLQFKWLVPSCFVCFFSCLSSLTGLLDSIISRIMEVIGSFLLPRASSKFASIRFVCFSYQPSSLCCNFHHYTPYCPFILQHFYLPALQQAIYSKSSTDFACDATGRYSSHQNRRRFELPYTITGINR